MTNATDRITFLVVLTDPSLATLNKTGALQHIASKAVHILWFSTACLSVCLSVCLTGL